MTAHVDALQGSSCKETDAYNQLFDQPLLQPENLRLTYHLTLLQLHHDATQAVQVNISYDSVCPTLFKQES